MSYGFIGLGHQGTPMAERMISSEMDPWLWVRRPEVLDRYRHERAHLATTPAELGAQCDVIGLSLYDAAATDTVLFGPDGLMEGARPGTVLAVHATVGPDYVKGLAARVADAGVAVVDVPVSGGDAAAEGRLLVIAGGRQEALARCSAMFSAYAGRVVIVGDVGAAQAAKLVNDCLMTAITGLVFEAFEFGEALGVDRAGLGDVLANGSAANPSVDICAAIGEEQFSLRAWPALHKDVALAKKVTSDPYRLIDVAAATAADMQRRRAHLVHPMS